MPASENRSTWTNFWRWSPGWCTQPTERQNPLRLDHSHDWWPARLQTCADGLIEIIEIKWLGQCADPVLLQPVGLVFEVLNVGGAHDQRGAPCFRIQCQEFADLPAGIG